MCNRCHSTLDNRALQCALREAEAAAARACECARAAETAGCRAAEMARAAEQAACRAENAASAALTENNVKLDKSAAKTATTANFFCKNIFLMYLRKLITNLLQKLLYRNFDDLSTVFKTFLTILY